MNEKTNTLIFFLPSSFSLLYTLARTYTRSRKVTKHRRILTFCNKKSNDNCKFHYLIIILYISYITVVATYVAKMFS